MIYFDNTTTTQTAFFPVDGWTSDNAPGQGDVFIDPYLYIEGVDGETTALEVSAASVSGGFIAVSFALPEGLAAGEYQYLLTLSGDPAGGYSTGLAVIPESVVTTTTYDTDINFVQYGEQ